MRHASFFSGVGGLDLGFEKAGIKTVSVCEIDPYASSVLEERFPDAPNLGSITEINANDIPEADIWSGGFPCQDLSVAGKRAGFAGKRSSLAFTFLDLVEQRRPRWIVLENVPGLFSSNKGADFGRLLYEMEQIGYGVAWRTLDARYFGVPQRRRRVFLVGSLGSDRAGAVLFECESCERHPSPRISSWQETSKGTSVSVRGNRNAFRKGKPSTKVDSNGMRAADGLAGQMDNQQIVDTLGATTHRTLQARDWKTGVNNQDINALSNGEGFLISFPSRYSMQPTKFNDQSDPITIATGAPAVFRKSARVSFPGSPETWVDDGLANTLNSFDVGDIRTTHVVVGTKQEENDSLPKGLDGHRYRCIGNGVVANVAEWIGIRIAAVDVLE